MKLTNSISSCVRALNTKRNAEQDKQAAQKYAGALNGLSKASADLRVLCDVVSKLSEAGIACFGPRANAAIIEGSKIFSKNLMKKYGIPTAKYEVFTTMDEALEYLNKVRAVSRSAMIVPSEIYVKE